MANFQDSRFTPNNGSISEDIIGDVILGKDLNSFIASRQKQQQQTSYGVYSQNNESNIPDIGKNTQNIPSFDNIIVNSAPNLYGTNISNNDDSSNTIIKVVKLKFEIDFQINLNIVSK